MAKFVKKGQNRIKVLKARRLSLYILSMMDSNFIDVALTKS